MLISRIGINKKFLHTLHRLRSLIQLDLIIQVGIFPALASTAMFWEEKV